VVFDLDLILPVFLTIFFFETCFFKVVFDLPDMMLGATTLVVGVGFVAGLAGAIPAAMVVKLVEKTRARPMRSDFFIL
jgi:hypothetical protein